jgi:sugar lactone lactonase YvrE
VFDSSGNLIVVDVGSYSVRKITPGGVVTTLAGLSGTPGFTNGTGTAALFKFPRSIAVDRSGNFYVADQTNKAVRKITSAGVVTTYYTPPNSYSSYGVAVDSSGNLYVSSGNLSAGIIQKITPGGTITTLVGSTSTGGHIDGTGTSATFTGPLDIALDDVSGIIYVSDSDYSGGSARIRKVVISTGVVSTLSTLSGNGAGDNLISVDGAGNLFLSRSGLNIIYKVSAAGALTVLAGSGGAAGFNDATGASAKFNNPVGITTDADGNLYVMDYNNGVVRKIE